MLVLDTVFGSHSPYPQGADSLKEKCLNKIIQVNMVNMTSFFGNTENSHLKLKLKEIH